MSPVCCKSLLGGVSKEAVGDEAVVHGLRSLLLLLADFVDEEVEAGCCVV
jgi:hypothetical protein